MFLVEQSELPDSVLPIAEFRAHLRLGTGFSDDTIQDPVLASTLRAAIARVEVLCAKAVLQRAFVWTLHAWGDLGRQVLPRAPLVDATDLSIFEPDGTREVIAEGRFYVEHDAHRPAIVSKGFMLPQIPIGGHAEITFVAGYAGEWAYVPADLAFAILCLAASYYEDRATVGTMPANLAPLIAPYRRLRLLGGF